MRLQQFTHIYIIFTLAVTQWFFLKKGKLNKAYLVTISKQKGTAVFSYSVRSSTASHAFTRFLWLNQRALGLSSPFTHNQFCFLSFIFLKRQNGTMQVKNYLLYTEDRHFSVHAACKFTNHTYLCCFFLIRYVCT